MSTLRDAVKRSAGLAAADLKGEKKTGLRVHGKAGQATCAVCGDTIPVRSPSPTPRCSTVRPARPAANRSRMRRLSRLLK